MSVDEIKQYANRTLIKSLYGANFTAQILNIYVPGPDLQFTYQVLGGGGGGGGGGVFTTPKLGTSSGTFPNLTVPLDNLFFAGEVCSEHYYVYAHGGYIAGNKSASIILDRIGANSAERKSTSEQTYIFSLLAVLIILC